MSYVHSPRRGTKDLKAGPNLPDSLRLQKLHIQHRAAERPRRPTEPGSLLAWGLGTPPRGAGRRPLQAAGPGLIDSHPMDEVLRALVLDLSLDKADEMPELCLGHHGSDYPAALPAGY